jgi:fructose-specific phosphotransferase system IIC component
VVPDPSQMNGVVAGVIMMFRMMLPVAHAAAAVASSTTSAGDHMRMGLVSVGWWFIYGADFILCWTTLRQCGTAGPFSVWIRLCTQ